MTLGRSNYRRAPCKIEVLTRMILILSSKTTLASTGYRLKALDAIIKEVITYRPISWYTMSTAVISVHVFEWR